MKQLQMMKSKDYVELIHQAAKEARQSSLFPEMFGFGEFCYYFGLPNGTCIWPKCRNQAGKMITTRSGDEFFCSAHCPICEHP